MFMSFIFVRHAQSQGNASGDYSTSTHDSLSEVGAAQARCLAHHLRPMGFARILVSPLTRALQTIEPYLRATGQIAEIWPELAEGCWQSPDLLAADDFPTEPLILPAGLAEHFRFRDGRAVRPCEHETYAQGRCRARLVLHRLVEQGPAGGDTLLITHGHMLRELLNLAFAPAQPLLFPHDNCAMTRLSRSADRWSIDYINRPTLTDPPPCTPRA